jgi:hypothetical protein
MGVGLMTTLTTVENLTAPTEFVAHGGVGLAYRRLDTPSAGAARVFIRHFMRTLGRRTRIPPRLRLFAEVRSLDRRQHRRPNSWMIKEFQPPYSWTILSIIHL